MNTENKSEKEQIIAFLLLCLRNWYVFLISGVICLALAVVYLKVKTPVYQVESSVALRHDESLTGSVSKQSGGLLNAIGLSRGTENIEDETIKMSSQGNIKQVVKTLDLNKIYTLVKCWGLSKTPLYDHSPVLINTHPTLADTLMGIIEFKLHVDKDGRGKLKVKYGDFYKNRFTIDVFPATVSLPIADFSFSLSPEYAVCKKPFDIKILYTNYDYIAQIYRDLIEIDFHKKNSDMISLVTQSPNPDLSKQLLWTTIDSYNKNWDADKEYVYTNTVNYMNQRLAENLLMLSEADRKIQQFKDRNNLTDIEADITYSYTVNAELQAKLIEAETQSKLVDIILDYINDENNQYALIPFSITTLDPSIADVIGKYNQELLKRVELSKSTIQTSAMTLLDEHIGIQRKNLLQSLNNIKKGMQTSVAELRKKEKELDARISNVPSIEQEYIGLKREQALQQSIYIFLLEKKEELGIRSVSLVPKLKVINEPFVVNELVSPKLLKTLLTALFFGGVVIPLAWIYGMPYIRTIRRKEE
ncbi:MAG: hypothetical protein LBS46_06975 [Dysgonamonadaceae bacterium]|jgi:uncharacterized protein involved in exopolysaccharide biosynthesis|nr:hypothetical protein [Dysgonamonadaceae bacterium]